MLSGKISANLSVTCYLAHHIVLGGVRCKSGVSALNYKQAF